MSGFSWETSLLVDGVEVSTLPSSWDALTRAVVISLFTWRRARPDDVLPDGISRMGWWGDALPSVSGDKIGSLLWRLRREPLSARTAIRAREYTEEALAWLTEDGICTRVGVTAERIGDGQLRLRVILYRTDGAVRELTFSDIWGIIHD